MIYKWVSLRVSGHRAGPHTGRFQNHLDPPSPALPGSSGSPVGWAGAVAPRDQRLGPSEAGCLLPPRFLRTWAALWNARVLLRKATAFAGQPSSMVPATGLPKFWNGLPVPRWFP